MKKGTAVFLALLLMMFCLSALAETPVESTEASAAQTVRGQSYPYLFQGSDESGDPCSFSCGNLVPSACRSSGIVTLIGQTTGGSCMVLLCTTAAGTVFQISGPLQMSTIRNGSFYNIDAGVEPDFRLSKPESFYDRPALVEYLHGLK